MANNIIGTVGIGAQSVKPDWNQNDPNAKDYIKNRPGGYVIPPSVEITWDGDTTGKETIDLGVDFTMVKIADEAPPIEKFAVKSDAGGHALVISRDGGLYDAATVHNPATLKLVNLGGTKGVVIEGLDALIINSSTPGSTKKFKITVDDAGTISATEVTT